MEDFPFNKLSHAGRRILVLVSCILFKWAIYNGNNLSIINHSELHEEPWLFVWLSLKQFGEPFLTKQLEFYCFFTFLKWLSHQVSSHPSNHSEILHFFSPSGKPRNLKIVNLNKVEMWQLCNYSILSYLFTNSLMAICNKIWSIFYKK